jgi:hypothetical protein
MRPGKSIFRREPAAIGVNSRTDNALQLVKGILAFEESTETDIKRPISCSSVRGTGRFGRIAMKFAGAVGRTMGDI